MGARVGVGILLLALTLVPRASLAAPGDDLRFVADGTSRVVQKADLRRACDLRTVEVDDPYYGEPRRFVACPLQRVFELGFAAGPDALVHREVLLRARDGYTRSASGRLLSEGSAYLALEDADRVARGLGGFDPIDRRQVDPSPFYLVWTGRGRNDTHRYPWPYQLAEIELASFETQFPHTVPPGAEPDSPPQRGYALFRAECAHCHAINGEGGKVGPELNVPRSIVEYRPEGQIKAYVRNPASFRYTTMPAHQHLSDAELDDLVAYFRHMALHKRDPAAPTPR